MSTVVYQQGVHTCIESSLVLEATTMRLKLVAPNCCKEVIRHNDYGNWSFFQSLSSQKAIEKERSYAHPWVSQPAHSKLSNKSLALCTESLGNETGSDTTQGSKFLFQDSKRLDTRSQEKMVPGEKIRVLVPQMGSKKVASRGFPPPLTTISSSSLLHVSHHREGGRLIIQAVETPYTSSCFQAERSHGRLRLVCSKST
ncbi:hypothetical protein L2E82_03869 [Cichorium intybus]|uniref:Uncharacterized protein n=1 Tax=Cichorium intybus TaxID=13427 RepID=A0ACB9H4I7_CICIN|nr:hypothetical protein L2E82_03869 [Cichorium intybus]